MVAVATEAKPVVVDTTDREVIRNILTELPMRHAFKAGETEHVLRAGGGREDRQALGARHRAVLMVVTDGDTVPATGMPKMPVSIGNNVVMVGVGNPTTGKSFGGHMSRQDVSTLRQVATRLNGAYHDGNEKHLTTELVSKIDEKADAEGGRTVDAAGIRAPVRRCGRGSAGSFAGAARIDGHAAGSPVGSPGPFAQG